MPVPLSVTAQENGHVPHTNLMLKLLAGDPWVNVKGLPFAAAGDGTTDDTAAIQAAIDYAIANNIGTVYFPSGTYIVTGLTFSWGVILQGAGPATSRGTTLKLAASATDHLLAPATDTEFMHYSMVRDMQLDGSLATGDLDLLHAARGGFNFGIHNVTFKSAPRYGLHLNTPTSADMSNLGFANCAEAAMYFLEGPGGTLVNAEIDNCGPYPILVEFLTGGTGEGQRVSLIDLKFEATLEGQHLNLIRVRPRTAGGGGTASFVISGLRASRAIGTSAEAAIYEENLAGVGHDYIIIGFDIGGGYTYGFKSDKQAITIASTEIGLWSSKAIPLLRVSDSITLGGDVVLSRTAANEASLASGDRLTLLSGYVTINQSAAGSGVMLAQVTGDAFPRYQETAEGEQLWGTGAAAADVSQKRVAANTLGLAAGDCYRTGKGATGSRPSASGVTQGAQWFDTTLGKPIWSDGTNWRDAAGTVV